MWLCTDGLASTPSAEVPSGISTMHATTVLNSTAAPFAASYMTLCVVHTLNEST